MSKARIMRWPFLTVIAIISIETALRFILGTPALSMKHPEIEYLFVPNQDSYRFGRVEKL